MTNFALIEIDQIRGKLKIFKLKVNDSCEYDDFEAEIKREGNFISELNTIETRLHDIADCKSLPENKFKDITPKNDSNKEYEIKTHHLRVYIFHEKNTGRIIVCAGKKGTQIADIKHFRRLKSACFNQKQ